MLPQVPLGDEGATSGSKLLNRLVACRQVPLDDEDAFLMVEDEADRVMPSAKAVQSAGRYDLHHAILFQGGYTAVREAHLIWLVS